MKGKKTGGRKPGSRNRTTVAIRQAIASAFFKMGGTAGLVRWGRRNPTEFYRIAARLIPHEVVGEGGGPINTKQSVTVKYVTVEEPKRAPAKAGR